MPLVAASPEFVLSVIRDPRVWAQVREDGLDARHAAYEPAAIYYRHPLGFVMFRQINVTLYEIHVAMLRGATGVADFVHACLAAMQARGARKFLAPIGEWNRAALRLAWRCGFIEEGRISAAYVRDGLPRAMVLMGGASGAL